MTNIDIPSLSSYQYELLCHAAQATVPVFLIVMPSVEDSEKIRNRLQIKNREVWNLKDLGLVEDVSDDFEEAIEEHHSMTGRNIRVYGLSEIGYLLFRDCDTRTIN